MQGFNDLTSKKDAFNGLLPAYLPALAKPQLLIAANLMALQSSFVKLKVGTLAITSVSDYICRDEILLQLPFCPA